MMKIKHLLDYFRDLAEANTPGEPVLKSGLLFRSSDFNELTMQEAEFLRDEINLGQVIDLRSPEELLLEPDVTPEGVKYTHIPLLDDHDNPAVTKKTRMAVLKRRMNEPGGMEGHMTEIYPIIVSSEQSQKGIRQVFDILLNKEEGKSIVYHCTQGKDRTGMISVLILSALGFSKERIIEDYMKYNDTHKMKRFWIFVGMTAVFFNYKLAKNLHVALITKKRYIEAGYLEIESKWGNAINYLKEAIGLTDADFTKLRTLYLKSV